MQELRAVKVKGCWLQLPAQLGSRVLRCQPSQVHALEHACTHTPMHALMPMHPAMPAPKVSALLAAQRFWCSQGTSTHPAWRTFRSSCQNRHNLCCRCTAWGPWQYRQYQCCTSRKLDRHTSLGTHTAQPGTSLLREIIRHSKGWDNLQQAVEAWLKPACPRLRASLPLLHQPAGSSIATQRARDRSKAAYSAWCKKHRHSG